MYKLMMSRLEYVYAKIINTFLSLNATLNVKSYMIQNDDDIL